MAGAAGTLDRAATRHPAGGCLLIATKAAPSRSSNATAHAANERMSGLILLTAGSGGYGSFDT